jgi:hypothetical protein
MSGAHIPPVRLLIAVALVAGVGCSFIPAYTAPAEFRAASFVPADTWLFGEMTLRPSLAQLASATRLADAFSSQPGWDANVRKLGPGATGPALSDVLTLLDGEVAIAAFGSMSAPSSDTPHYLLLAHSSDPDRLIRLLLSDSEVRGTQTLPPPRKDAHGANVYTSALSRGLATFRGWLILADSQRDLNDTLDRISGTSTTGSLDDAPHFKDLVTRLPVDRLGLEYIDSGALLRLAAPDLPMNESGVPPQTQALLSSVHSQFALSFAAVRNGLEIRLEGATQLPPETAGAAAAANISGLGDPGEAFNHLPANTLAAFGTGLPTLTPEIDDALNAELQQAADELDVPGLAGLEVHPSQWLAGPLAVGANADSVGEASGVPNVFLVAQVSDPTAARDDLGNLTALFPPKTVTTVPIADNQFFQAPLSGSEDQALTYGVADDWLYAVNGDAEAVVSAADSGGLTRNVRFAALESALRSDSANMFVDLEGIRDLTTSMLGADDRQTYDDKIRLLVNPLTYVGGSLRSDPNGDVHGHFVLGIAAPEK